MSIPDETINEVISATDLADIVSETVELTRKGSDLFGRCPFHDDRTPSFCVTPGKGLYRCFGCGESGNVVRFVMKRDGLTFPDAIKHLASRAGITIAPTPWRRITHPRMPQKIHQKAVPWQPEAPEPLPPALWSEKAERFVDWANRQLLENAEWLEWLSKRGLREETVREHRLGLNTGDSKSGKDLWRPRKSWGLETVLKSNGREKALWLPRGIVIPCLAEGRVARIRIRRSEGNEPRYYVVPGSSMRLMNFKTSTRVWVVVESDLDGLLVFQEAGDMVNVLVLGSNLTRPDQVVHGQLKNAALILYALDYDAGGRKAKAFWDANYPQAEHWPVPAGKDPGEAYAAGDDIREWVKVGIPSHLRTSGATAKVKGQARAAIQAEIEAPAAVRLLSDLLRKYPVKIRKTPDRTTIAEPPKWAVRNPVISKKISDLVFLNDDVFEWLTAHAAEVITGGNILLLR